MLAILLKNIEYNLSTIFLKERDSMNEKYYKVCGKCGHVGRNYFILNGFM